MANDLTKNPWIVDTVGVLVASDIVRVRGIRWVGGTTAGHVARLTDGSSRTFWSAVASGSNYIESDRPQVLNANPVGLKLEQLGSGILYIELG